jgi:hypothetical protein
MASKSPGGESVFDRLYHQSTVSSALKTRTTHPAPHSYKPKKTNNKEGNKNKSRSSSSGCSASVAVPDRLCKPTESKSKRPSPLLLHHPTGSDHSPLLLHNTNQRVSSYKPTARIPSPRSTSSDQLVPRETETTIRKTNLPAPTPTFYTSGLKLTYTSKYDKSIPKQVLPLSPTTSLKQFELIQRVLHEYESGLVNERKVAYELISALFYRDFMPGKHWDIDPATIVVVDDGDDGDVSDTSVVQFAAEKQATWDWKDIYSVASAKGTICFFKDSQEIRVQDYSYYVAG